MEIPPDLSIRTPSDLSRLLQEVLQLLETGVLRQCESVGPLEQYVDLRQLSPSGPWPDIVEADFVDAGGRRYHLFVDTFHGSGGEWREVDREYDLKMPK